MAGLRKRSLSIAGHATSVALEPAFWQVLDEMASARGLSLPALVAEIDGMRTLEDGSAGLASALRIHALRWALEGRRRP